MIEEALKGNMESEEEEIDDDLKNVHKDIVTKRAKLMLEHRMKRHTKIHLHRLELDDVKDDFK